MYSDLSGTTLGKYELLELIGEGGMGAVYRAYDESLQREVAIKVVNLGMGEPEIQVRFIREAQTSARLEHNHIVRVYDYGVEREINYVVMQYLNGGSLAERMRQAASRGRSHASLSEIALLLEHLAGALDYAHLHGVIHRDIKPQNIMLNNQGQAFIVDFGIAKILNDASSLTGTSTTIGTPSYMPPEQWGLETLTPAADQYALAVVTYQLVAGRLPFEADSVPSLWYKIEKEDATPVHIIRPDVSPSLMLVISRAMAKIPSERFPNCTQFAQAFAAVVSSGKEDLSDDYFTFNLAKPPSSSRSPFLTPRVTKTVTSSSGTLRESVTSRPTTVVEPVAPAPAGRPRAVYIVGLVGLLLAALLAFLFFNNNGADSAAQMTLTAVNRTLIAAGLATEDQATQNREIEKTASVDAIASQPTPELETLAVTLSPALTADTVLIPPTVATLPVGDSTAQAEVTHTPDGPPTAVATLTDTPTITVAPTETPTDTPDASPTPVTPENTGTMIAIFNATQQAIFDATITGAPLRSPTALPITVADAANADWSPVEETFDGVPMVLVPAGCFKMGSALGERDERDPHMVCIDMPFWLDETEVTQGQFMEIWGIASEMPAFTGDLLPVEQITWFEAVDYCAARGGRLPTEAEWEFAARGPEAWIYPWGDDLASDRAIYNGNSGGKTGEVGSRPQGASWVGALDMAGNVWEWTGSAYQPYPYDAADGREQTAGSQAAVQRVIRGGSWKTGGRDLRGSKRLDASPAEMRDQIGFRCARDF